MPKHAAEPESARVGGEAERLWILWARVSRSSSAAAVLCCGISGAHHNKEHYRIRTWQCSFFATDRSAFRQYFQHFGSHQTTDCCARAQDAEEPRYVNGTEEKLKLAFTHLFQAIARKPHCEKTTAAPFCRGLLFPRTQPRVTAHTANCSSDWVFFPFLDNIFHCFFTVLKCLQQASPTAQKRWMGEGQDGIGFRAAVGMFYKMWVFWHILGDSATDTHMPPITLLGGTRQESSSYRLKLKWDRISSLIFKMCIRHSGQALWAKFVAQKISAENFVIFLVLTMTCILSWSADISSQTNYALTVYHKGLLDPNSGVLENACQQELRDNAGTGKSRLCFLVWCQFDWFDMEGLNFFFFFFVGKSSEKGSCNSSLIYWG